jgi:2-hydroxychromene-2-carboxylate isomerase
MKAPVEFWFDFVSPYAYIAAQSIEQIAARHGRDVSWKPMLLGAVFKVTSSSPLTMRPPVMADYFKHDFLRSARYAGVPFVMPEPFPIATQNTCRVCLWLQDTAPQCVGEFVRQITRAYFSGPAALNDIGWLASQIAAMGLDGAASAAACDDIHYKEALKAQCGQAIEKGIFGAPWIIVDGESFWGNDRLPQVEQWLVQGGF